MELETYIQYHETKIHEQPDFAYNTYLCTIPDDFKRVPLHWHEQMEIIYIKKGTGIVFSASGSEQCCFCPVFYRNYRWSLFPDSAPERIRGRSWVSFCAVCFRWAAGESG